jgi:BirA family biotin operon repressor/biotin-[acetyl-CoA-carboxylase] ligase
LNGKKIGGILLENSLSGSHITSSVVGIGLNVNQHTFESPNASSLSLAFNRPIDRYELLNKLLHYLDENLPLDFESLSLAEIQTIHKVYETTLWGLHEQRWYQAAGETFLATLKGVDEQGLLILETNQAIKRFEIKSVQFLNHPVD